MSSALVAASWVGDRFSSDPDLLAPVRPRLIPELVIVPFGRDGYLFEGAKQTQVIRGRSTRSLFPRLFSLLDGTRTLPEICSEIEGCQPQAIRDSIYLLYSRGLLEDGIPNAIAEPLLNTDSFAGRFVDVTRVNRSRTEVLAKLAGTQLLIIGNPEIAAFFEKMLANCGIGQIRVAPSGTAVFQNASFAVVIGVGENDNVQPELLGAYTAKVPVMHIRIGHNMTQIGPVFYPGESACPECMSRLYDIPPGDPTEDGLRFALSLGALQLFHLLSRLANPHLFNAFQLFQATDYGLLNEHQYITRLPGCKHCGPTAAPLDRSSSEYLTWVLNTAIAFPARHLYDPSEYQGHFRASNVLLTNDLSEPYYGAEPIPLPPPEPLLCPPAWVNSAADAPALTFSGLSTLLYNSVGYQKNADGGLRRVAPTGGGLGSPDIFVVALDVPGLHHGVYHYDAPRHNLEKLPYPFDIDWRATLGFDGPLPSCFLIGTGAAGRLYMKYQNFSYRIVYLDAGVAQAYLVDIAHALGLTVHHYENIADGPLEQALRVAKRRNQNIITFACGVTGALPKPNKPANTFSPQVIDHLVDATLHNFHSAAEIAPSGSLQVSALQANAKTFGQLLLGRRSTRAFAEQQASGEQLRIVLEAMDAFNATSLHRLRFWLALRSASTCLKAGIYRFSPESAKSFLAVRDSLSFEDVLDLVSQRNVASAPAVVLCTGDLGAALRQRGARGYRELLQCAGGAVARGLLATTYVGLSSSPFGGIFDAGFRSLTGADGYRDCPLFGFVLGQGA